MTTLSVCVFCGSRDGIAPQFAAEAEALGQALATAGHRLVYGAGDVGLMGRVARSHIAAGGEVFGVIPVNLFAREVGKTDVTHFVITETMHERKKVMFMNADVITLLPGGPGSLDEFFEVVTWAQIGLHTKPIYIINTDGYWNKLIDLLNHVVDQGFAAPDFARLFTVVNSVPDLMTSITGLRS